MHEFMLNIDNKEILNEILHHSVDYLIGSPKNNLNPHKYGFAETEDFESALKTIANVYKSYVLHTLPDAELLSHFSHMNQELQHTVLDVVKARKDEIAAFLLREHNSRNNKLVTSFDWDVKFIIGDSSLSSHRKEITTLILNCTEGKGNKSTVNLEMDMDKLDKFIKVLEDCNKKLSSVN